MVDCSPAEADMLVFLGLGSNQGDGREIIAGAAKALSERLHYLKLSSLYQSDPMYVLDQPNYLNAVVSGSYVGTPLELLSFIQQIEATFGRNRTKERRRGERTLDIDILLFGDQIVSAAPQLEIPHPCLLERKFALLPLLELEPLIVDPRDGRALIESFLRLGDQGIYYADLSSYNQDNGFSHSGGRTEFSPQGI